MKEGLKLLALAAATLVAVSSCADLKYDAPLLTEPKVEGLTPNVTIAELKSEYASVPDREAQEIEYDYVLRAVVTANDISGNIYKNVYVEDNTGGIAISIDQNNLSGIYSVGQEIYIDLHGLAISMYGGQPSIGYAGTNANRIPYEVAEEKIRLSGWPDEEQVSPLPVKLSQLSDDLIGRLVRIDNVIFEEAGEIFAPAEKTVNRAITDASGGSIIVRNSGYADFAADKMPKGVGTLIGVLSKFGNDYQLFLRSREDVIGFTGTGGLPTPDEPGVTPPEGDAKVILEVPFSGTLSPFVEYSVSGDKQRWRADQYKDDSGAVKDSYAKMNGYANGTGQANEDWLISPPMSLEGATSVILSFEQAINFFESASVSQRHRLLVSTDYNGGDPTAATWTEVTIPYPSTPSWKFIPVTISFPESVLGKPTVRFAFCYLSVDGAASTWEIKKLKLSAVGGGELLSSIEPMG